MTTWRLPYRSMDAAGTPEAASSVAWEWINDLAAAAMEAGDPASMHIERDGGSSALYRGTILLAVATVFRDPMNFSVLVRWMDAEFEQEVE